MGCGASSISDEEDGPSAAATRLRQHGERERERKLQIDLAINQQRPMGWLFKYPEPQALPPKDHRAPKVYSTQTSNSRSMSTNNSGKSYRTTTTDDSDDVDPYLPGPYLHPLHLTAKKGGSHG